MRCGGDRLSSSTTHAVAFVATPANSLIEPFLCQRQLSTLNTQPFRLDSDGIPRHFIRFVRPCVTAWYGQQLRPLCIRRSKSYGGQYVGRPRFFRGRSIDRPSNLDWVRCRRRDWVRHNHSILCRWLYRLWMIAGLLKFRGFGPRHVAPKMLQ